MQARKKKNGKAAPASTSEILCNPGREKVNSKSKTQFERLTDLREAISRGRSEHALDALSEQPSFSSHMADAATDVYDRDLALGMLSTDQDAIYQIDQALDRI